MAAPNPKSSYLPALYAFAIDNMDTAYEKLADAAREAGWRYRLQQHATEHTPQGNIMVAFDVYVGRADDAGTFEFVDRVSTQVLGNTQLVSLVARAQLDSTLMHIFFGRLPPMPEPAMPTAAEQQIQVPDADVDLDDVTNPDRGRYEKQDDEGGEYVPAVAPFKPVFVNVVKGKTADGLPILTDLYELGANKEDIIFAVKHTLREALEGVDNLDTLGALYKLNVRELEFVSDLGGPDDFSDVRDLLAGRVVTLATAALERITTPENLASFYTANEAALSITTGTAYGKKLQALFGARKEALTKTAPRRRTANGG